MTRLRSTSVALHCAIAIVGSTSASLLACGQSAPDQTRAVPDAHVPNGAPDADAAMPAKDRGMGTPSHGPALDARARTDAANPVSANWQPGFPLGAPGWRESLVPACDTRPGPLVAHDVWADARGVFALTSDRCVPEGGDLPYCTEWSLAAQGTSLLFNDGRGWQSVLESPGATAIGLAGFAGGPLVMTTDDCSAKLVDFAGSVASCSLPVDTNAGRSPARVFVAGPDRAYAAEDDKIAMYEGGDWHTIIDGLPDMLTAMWASTDVAYFAGAHQPYVWRADAPAMGLVALPDAPVSFYTAVWALENDDVWFGTAAGQLVHRDGASYRVFQVSTAYEPIVGLWGQGDQLFYHTRSTFGRISGAQAEKILDVPPGTSADKELEILAIWGTSPREVFLALADRFSVASEDCNARFMLYFDGQELHRF